MLRVSVIVPTCERPVLLARALRSVAAQHTAPAEVVVVDDADPRQHDVVERVAGTLGLRGVVVCANRRAKGASGARNSGAERASGDVLAFLDDDDEWDPSHLRDAMGVFESSALEMLCTDLVYRSEDAPERPGKPAPDELLPSQFLTRNPGLVGSNIIIRRSLYGELGGFDESLRAAADMDFGLRLGLRGGVRYAPLHRPLVYHHHHGSPRLCMRRGEAMRMGIRRFYELHHERMTDAQQEEFRRAVRRLWAIDEYGRDVT